MMICKKCGHVFDSNPFKTPRMICPKCKSYNIQRAPQGPVF